VPTIDQLDIKITSSTDSANKSIADLQSSLAKLNAAMSGMNTAGNTVVSAMQRMGNAVTKLQQGLNSFNVSGVISKLEEFSRGLNTIQISSNLGRNLSNLAGGIKSLNSQLGGNFQGLASVGDALKPLSNIETDGSVTKLVAAIKKLPEAMSKLNEADTGLFRQKVSELTPALQEMSTAVATGVDFTSLNKMISGIKKLPDAISKLNAADVGTFRQRVSELTPALEEMNTAAATANANLTGIGQNIRSVASATRALNNSGSGSSGSSGGLTRALGLGVSIVMLRRVAHGLANVIDLSNKYQEDLNLFTAALGKYAGEAKEYAETVSTVMGIDPAEWLRAQGVFQTLITGFGVVNDRAIVMSRNLTQLGYDISSYFNISVSEAMTKLQSGISGELEPLRRLGFDLSEARLKALALSKGIDETYSKMTQAEKSQLRYEAIMNQVTVAQGDMARTLDAPANQLRILQAQVTQAGRALGNIFIPMLNAILPVATAVVKGIRAIADAIASLFGFTLTEVDYSGITDATDSTDSLSDSLSDATGSAKGLQKQLMKFDEINQFNDTSSGGGGGSSAAASGSQWEWELSDYDFLGTAINSKVDAVYAKIKPVVDWIIDNLTNVKGIALAVGAAFTGWVISSEILNGLRKVAGFGVQIKTLFAGIFTTGATVALTIHFEKEFLDTGKMTSFGKQILSTALGSTLAGALLSTVTSKLFPGMSKGNAIALGSSVVLGVSGVATLFVAVDDAMEQGWNYKNIAETLTGYFETAMAGAVGFKALGKDAKSGFGLGLSVAGVVTLTATASDVMAEGWNKKNFVSSLLGTFSTVTGMAAAAPAFRISAGKGAALGLAVAGVATLSASVASEMKEGCTKESIIGALAGTFATVTGVAVFAPAIGLTTSQGTGLGLEVAAVATLASVVVDEAENGINETTIKNGVIGILEATSGAFLLSGGNLFITLAALGISTAVQLGAIAINYSKRQLTVHANHTADEIREVANNIFSAITADANITLEPQITNVEQAAAQFNEAAKDFKDISVPVNLTPESADDILAKLNGLIKSANALEDAEKAKLQAFIEISPVGSLTGENNDLTKLLTGGVITSDLEAAGKGLSDALQKGMKDGWTEGLTELYNMYRNDILVLTSSLDSAEVQGTAKAGMAGIMRELKGKDYTSVDIDNVVTELKTLENETRSSLGKTYDTQRTQAYTRLADYENKSKQWAELAKRDGISDEERKHYEEKSAEFAKYASELAAELDKWDKDTWVSDAIKELFGDTYKELEQMRIDKGISELGLFNFSQLDSSTSLQIKSWAGDTPEQTSSQILKALNAAIGADLNSDAYKLISEIPDNFYAQLAARYDAETLNKTLHDLGITFPGQSTAGGTSESITAVSSKIALEAIDKYDFERSVKQGMAESDAKSFVEKALEAAFGDNKPGKATPELVEALKQLYDGDGSYIENALEQLGVEILKIDTSSEQFKASADVFQSAGNTIKSGANSFGSDVSEFDSTVASMKKWIESKLAKPTSTNTGDGDDPPPVETHASGGYPASGSLFIAGEAGPELVGKIGNKTAVVNDEQIAMTLSRQMGGAGGIDEAALATAIVSALQSAGMGAVYLDGQQLARSINRETQRTGRSAIMI